MIGDDEPVRPIARQTHLIGERLDDLSVGDFDHRISLLRTEIDRLESAKRLKQAALAQAGSVFRSDHSQS